MKRNKISNKGFTLIEILSVIVILGVLMIIAVPSVTDYILESRKDAYVSTINGYVNSLKNKITNFEYHFTRKDTTYYVHIDNIELEQGGENPYGEWVDAYVVVTYDGLEHTYYWVSIDSAGYEVELKLVSEITVDDITLDGDGEVNNRESIGGRPKIYLLEGNGQVSDDTTPVLKLDSKKADECYVYSINDGFVTINEYKVGCPTDVEIPSSIAGYPVTTLGTYSFAKRNITSVKIPEGIITIDASAFSENNISNVSFPSTLTSIGSLAFSNNKLTSISLPASVTIGAGAFTKNLIPEESAMIYKLNDDGSSDYSTLIGYAGSSKSIVIPESINGVALKTISGSAFRNLGLTSVVIPDSVETIGSFAFSGNKLTTVDLPSSLKKIEGAAFASNLLTTIDIPSSVTSLASRSFNNNYVEDGTEYVYKRNADGSVDYSTIVSYAGRNKNIIIPTMANNVTLKTIAASAFFSTGLTSVVIPDTVTSIDRYAFNSNSLSPEQAFIYKRNADGTVDYTTLIGYGGRDRGTVDLPVEIPAAVNGVQLSVISDYAFGETSLKGVIIPEGVTSINQYAFYACYLTEVTIPSTVTSIGKNAFRKVLSWGDFNPIEKIVNKTGKSFNWQTITNSNYTANFVTGTVKHQYGNFEVVAG